MNTEEAVGQRHSFSDGLRRAVAGCVYVPGDPDWDRARTPWALAVDQTPLAVVEVEEADDVRLAVCWAAERGHQVTAQPVGHGANDALDQVLLLRTRSLDLIDIDLAKCTATVGAGVKVGELLAALKGSGLTFLAGSSSDISVVGLSIAGGVSWFGRAYGLAANSIESAEMIDGQGHVRRITPLEEPDLFWAIRGGGGDFGVITALEIKLHPGQELHGGRIVWPADQAETALRAFRDAAETAPGELTPWFYGYKFPPLPSLPEDLRGKAFVAIAAAYLGSASDAQRVLQPLTNMPGRVLGGFAELPMEELANIAGEPTEPMRTHEHSLLLNDLSDEVISVLVDITGAASESPISLVKLMRLGGQFQTKLAGAGACGHLDEPYLLLVGGLLERPGVYEALDESFGRLDQVLVAHTNGRTIPNFLEPGGDVNRVWKTDTRSRLSEIKRAVDPMSTIRSNRPVLTGQPLKDSERTGRK
jgi:hypothetical protein